MLLLRDSQRQVNARTHTRARATYHTDRGFCPGQNQQGRSSCKDHVLNHTESICEQGSTQSHMRSKNTQLTMCPLHHQPTVFIFHCHILTLDTLSRTTVFKIKKSFAKHTTVGVYSNNTQHDIHSPIHTYLHNRPTFYTSHNKFIFILAYIHQLQIHMFPYIHPFNILST